VDLTRLMAEELGLSVNEDEFEVAQAMSKEASKASSKKGGIDIVKLDVHDIAALEQNDDMQKTVDSAKFGESYSLFLPLTSYGRTLSDLGNIKAIVKAIFYQKHFVQSTNEIPENSTFVIILDRTSFYAEAGGQEYDTGNIVVDGLADFEVTNVRNYNGYVLHTGHLKYGQLALQDSVIASYDEVSCWKFPRCS